MTCLWIALLALVPQLLGHTSFNWALRWLPASLVAVALLGEPIGSSALAFVLLREVPGPVTLAGAALILAGIAVVARSTPTTAPREPRRDASRGRRHPRPRPSRPELLQRFELPPQGRERALRALLGRQRVGVGQRLLERAACAVLVAPSR